MEASSSEDSHDDPEAQARSFSFRPPRSDCRALLPLHFLDAPRVAHGTCPVSGCHLCRPSVGAVLVHRAGWLLCGATAWPGAAGSGSDPRPGGAPRGLHGAGVIGRADGCCSATVGPFCRFVRQGALRAGRSRFSSAGGASRSGGSAVHVAFIFPPAEQGLSSARLKEATFGFWSADRRTFFPELGEECCFEMRWGIQSRSGSELQFFWEILV
jgi:hypothetical protein